MSNGAYFASLLPCNSVLVQQRLDANLNRLNSNVNTDKGLFRFCLNFSRSTFAVSIIDLSEMTENVETEVTLPVEMADTETQILDNLLTCSYKEMKFEIIRKRKRNIENALADLKKVEYFSQESNRPPCNRFLSWSFIQWVYSIT